MNVKCTLSVVRMLDALIALEVIDVSVERDFKAMDSIAEVLKIKKRAYRLYLYANTYL